MIKLETSLYQGQAKLEVAIQDAREFLRALTPWGAEEYLFKGYLFRGHSNSRFPLVPSALRVNCKQKLWKAARLEMPIDDQSEWLHWQVTAEREVLAQFFLQVNSHGLKLPFPDRLRGTEFVPTFISPNFGKPDMWLPRDLYDLSALAQHYGIPTRLLDWSFDPLVAAYFSSANLSSDSEEICVWCLNAEMIGSLNSTVDQIDLDIIVPPYNGNPNLTAQRGAFTLVQQLVDGHRGSLERFGRGEPPILLTRQPLDEYLTEQYTPRSGDPAALVKLCTPAKNAEEILALLVSAGMGPARLFPGIDGVVRQLLE